MTEQVKIERTYRHSPDAVFEAWIDVDLLSQWFGCDTNSLWQIDRWEPEVGGLLKVHMEMDGQLIEMSGQFIDVDRPHLLRYRWGQDQTVTVEFFAEADGCRVVVTHEGSLGPGMAPILNGGWSASVVQLEALLDQH